MARPRFNPGPALAGTRPLVLAAAVAVIVTLVATLVQPPVPAVTEGATSVQPIGSSVLLCPEPGAGTDLGVRVTAAIVPGQPGQDVPDAADDEPSAAGLETLPGRESASSRILVPGGQAQIEAFGTRLPAIRAFGEGNLAPGLVADQWGRDPGGRGRGMASTECAPAASEFWFVGGGAIAGRQTRIVLVNPDETAAVVDVLIHGPNGLIDAPRARPGDQGQDRLVERLDARSRRHGDCRSGAGAHGTRRGVGRRRAARRPGDGRNRPDPRPMRRRRRSTCRASSAAVRACCRWWHWGRRRDREHPPHHVRGHVHADRPRAARGAGRLGRHDRHVARARQAARHHRFTSDVPIVAGKDVLRRAQPAGRDGVHRRCSPSSPRRRSAACRCAPRPTCASPITAPDTAAEVDIVLLPFRGGKEAAVPTEPRRVRIGAGRMRSIARAARRDRLVHRRRHPGRGSGPVLVVIACARIALGISSRIPGACCARRSVPTAQQDPLSRTVDDDGARSSRTAGG